MEKVSAFFISLIFTSLVAGNYLFFYNFSSNLEEVIILRAIDGDTIELGDGRVIRLLNVNTPESGEFGSENAKKYLSNLEGQRVGLEIEGVGRYGRQLGKIYSENYVNLELVELGLAHKYLVSESELNDFKLTEKKAREREIGIWEKSDYYGCLNVEINKYDEVVDIISDCPVDLDGWTLKDETTKSYTFDGIGVQKFRIYSGEGVNNENEFYWGRGKVWNDDKDSIFIRDSEGKLVHYDSYGY